jgi:hypothetical protein
LCAYFAFAAAQQARDVGAVHDPQQNGKRQKQGATFGKPKYQSARGVRALAMSAASEE